jgi:hypothetical protein
MSLVKSLLFGTAGGTAQSGQAAGRQQGRSGGVMQMVKQLTKSSGGPMLTGVTMLASAYRSRKRRRGRPMLKAALGVGLIGFGLWQRRKRSRGMGGMRQGGESWQQGGQQQGGQRQGGGSTGQYGG